MHSVKVLIFDYFGVIATDAYWYTVKNIESKSNRSQQIDELVDRVNTGKISWHDYCLQVANDLNISVKEVENRYSQHNINKGLVTLISNLKQSHDICLASNAAGEFLRPILSETNLEEIFQEVFVSSEIGYAKPDYRFYEYIINRLDVKAESCVMIDDNSNNVEAARDLNIQGIVYKSNVQLREELLKIL